MVVINPVPIAPSFFHIWRNMLPPRTSVLEHDAPAYKQTQFLFLPLVDRRNPDTYVVSETQFNLRSDAGTRHLDEGTHADVAIHPYRIQPHPTRILAGIELGVEERSRADVIVVGIQPEPNWMRSIVLHSHAYPETESFRWSECRPEGC